MIIEASETIEIVLAASASVDQPSYEVAIASANGTTYVQASSEYGNTNSVTPVVMVTGESSRQKRILGIHVFNRDIVTHTVTIRRSGSLVLKRATLAVNCSLHYSHESGWQICDSTGTPVTTGTPGTNGADGSDGALTVSETEIDFGAIPLLSKEFTVTDAAVTTSSKIIAVQSGKAATGRDADENAFDALVLRCVPGDGEFTLYANSVTGVVSGKYKVNYQFS